ncbi:MAG: hypothetical protein QXJ28_02330, partial [Candidatus Pacearchaeota archaeon]
MSDNIQKEMNYIKEHQKEITLIRQTLSLLHWDQETYMPKKGELSRAEQCSYLSKTLHKKVTEDKFFKAIRKLFERRKKLNFEERRMVEKLYKDISKARKIPNSFIEELSKTTSLAFSAWLESRKKNDF